MSFSKRFLSISKIALCVIREVGEITLESFFNEKYARYYGYTPYRRNSVSSALTRLKKSNLIEQRGRTFYLTEKGEKQAFFAYINREVSNFKLEKRKWDKKWRFVFFDVPETKRTQREYLRFILRTVGFKEYQKSVWAYPHKVPSFIKELLWEESIKPFTRFITVDEIDYDRDLREKFNLS